MKATEIGTLVVGGVALLVLHGLTKKEGGGGDCGCDGKCSDEGLSGIQRSDPQRLAAPCQSNYCWTGLARRTREGGVQCYYISTRRPGCERTGTPNSY